MLDVLPYDVWDAIFPLCCVDGGYTGRSLALVSRQCNQLSAPYKYQSVMADSARKIVLLFRALKDTPSHRRRVRHLFLGTSETPRQVGILWSDPKLFPPQHSSALTVLSRLGALMTGGNARDSISELCSFIIPILILTSGTLRTLCLVSQQIPLAILFLDLPCQFPVLNELTLHIYKSWKQHSRRPPTKVIFPVLKRLHLGQPYAVDAIKRIGYIAPRLEYFWAPINTRLVREIPKAFPLLKSHVMAISAKATTSIVRMSNPFVILDDDKNRLVEAHKYHLKLVKVGWLERQIGKEGHWECKALTRDWLRGEVELWMHLYR
ncbi:hypothetical protein AX16_003773 [Volvariella volvacea WC 439]|nr:hypothetical protein AX16_003773 [Volvariella volvacea WC 439]